ncbi:unnamed protein product [Rotaria sp. Silwood1]|nr:unnamed protein product [Rotaria sp. Silwood1]CAF1408997.1 unnamed protein product [Rotaria sp. Silwood1]CAF3574526.1 unnamed protein product [Rotaria sp. Silwood1]CAF3600417.1 unnamed protein product [Rotaria sp. Silwood1]CAF3634603.1 unnamed protein product [Rotaria sp. Silwood1]
MFSRLIINRNLQQTSLRLLSSLSKNYICDSSVIEAYHTNPQLKSIIDRQEHQFYYHVDSKIKQQLPAVFKQIPSSSHSLTNSYYLTNSTYENKADNTTTKKISIDEFINLTWWNDRSKGKFPGVIGMEIVSMSHGYVSCQLKIREELLAPNGYLHAGVIVTLADTACGYGCLNSKPSEAKSFTTIELKSNFMGTVKAQAVVTCEARLIHEGKTTQIWDAEVIDLEKNKLIAIFRCTELILY